MSIRGSAQPLVAIGVSIGVLVLLGWLGPPDPTASWLPKPIAGMEFALENAFDAREGLGTLCADRARQPLAIAGRTLDLPACWTRDASPTGLTLADTDLRLLHVKITGARDSDPNWSALSARVATERALPGARVEAKDGKVLVYNVVPAEMASDDHVWSWSDGSAAMIVTVRVPRWCSRSWKTVRHLGDVDAAVHSLRAS